MVDSMSREGASERASDVAARLRVRHLNAEPVRADGRYVVYWMTAYRRATDNFALEYACRIAAKLDRPLVVLEALRCGYPHASDRLHRFVLEGMADNLRSFSASRATYLAYAERRPNDGAGLLEALTKDACAVVGDDWPCFFHPRMHAAAAKRSRVRFSLVDGNGILPMRALDRVFPTAYAFRRVIQKIVAPFLEQGPHEAPLELLPRTAPPVLARSIGERWTFLGKEVLDDPQPFIASLPIDHEVGPADMKGGATAARQRLEEFLESGLERYAEERSEPSSDASSGLSPWLHFGHIGVHHVFRRLAEKCGWSLDRMGKTTSGKKEGFWNMGTAADAFLDELVTWRELGFNMCSNVEGYDRFASLPEWARATLAKHGMDRREPLYELDTFEKAATHDDLWNAAQRQLVREGRMHNYLRMLWGKKILEWSRDPETALEVMIHLNNRHAVDGRDPNSYSGIFWCLGRYDRPWAPERPVFGVIRYMSSDNTRRKLHVKDYLSRYGREPRLF